MIEYVLTLIKNNHFISFKTLYATIKIKYPHIGSMEFGATMAHLVTDGQIKIIPYTDPILMEKSVCFVSGDVTIDSSAFNDDPFRSERN